VGALAKLLTVATIAATAAFAAPLASACGAGTYTYAGIAGAVPVSGVGARITSGATGLNVVAGHVAGWVGVGGAGQGPGGADEWIQVGLSAFPQASGNDVYFEIARPGMFPTYHRLATDVAPGSTLRVAVLEMRGRHNWWRVWVNGRARSQPIFLPQSHRRWQPIVTAESWDGGAATCNDFLYQFAALRVARTPGGRWSTLQPAARIVNADYSRVLTADAGAFYAAGGPIGLRTLAGTASVPVLEP
jgi:hypothetical protein